MAIVIQFKINRKTIYVLRILGSSTNSLLLSNEWGIGVVNVITSCLQSIMYCTFQWYGESVIIPITTVVCHYGCNKATDVLCVSRIGPFNVSENKIRK